MYFFATLLILILSGCHSTPDYQQTRQLSKTHHQQLHTSSTGLPVTFWINKAPISSDTVRVYIEGDGRAWIRRSRAAADPTPRNRLVHSLMLQDPKNDTAYIGRPCQYQKNDQCRTDIWTFSRYSRESVVAINEALELIKKSKGYQHVELVGFSGGATIALLIAAQRNDIQSVRTIAGNLDPAFTNTFHNVSTMPTALNPSDFKDRLQHIPQWHFIGKSDPVIPPVIFNHYHSAFINTSCIKSQIVSGASHHSGWIEIWPKLLKLHPSCNKNQNNQ